jgi:hypothetical protein
MHCTPSPNYTHRLNIKKLTALCITNKNHPNPENTHHVCADLKEKIHKKDQRNKKKRPLVRDFNSVQKG